MAAAISRITSWPAEVRIPLSEILPASHILWRTTVGEER